MIHAKEEGMLRVGPKDPRWRVCPATLVTLLGQSKNCQHLRKCFRDAVHSSSSYIELRMIDPRKSLS